jgi:hydroxymethylglutaryl-CoA reductase
MDTPTRHSRISGFHKLPIAQRIEAVARFAGLDAAEQAHLANTGNLPAELADHLIENLVGTMNIPVGIATNMKVDGQDRLIPMATEESSVVAAVCNAARQCYDNGGFITSMSGTQMIAQIQLTGVRDPEHARIRILERRAEIQAICDECDPVLLRLGGGFRDLEVRVLATRGGAMVITHLVVDTRDAMGANAVNTMAEKLAPSIAGWTGGQTNLRILSNLADRRLARARCVWRVGDIGGEAVRDAMVSAYHFADADPYRAATHNKGIMNGISAVVLATGNDTRAVEAGAHAYAARAGHYGSLTRWEVTNEGDLAGSIEVPMAVGLVGGATKLHPTARLSLKILGVQTAEELARIIAAVGLAQNFSALKALATTGIQKGHMALHSKNIAMMAGAVGEEIDRVARMLVEKGTVRIDVAEAELRALRAAGA